MNQPIAGDFATIMDQANRMSQSAVAHPFGSPAQRLAQGPGLPVQQTTQMFYCPRDIAEYDACCNRLWAGQATPRYEERTFTKEGELLIVLCYFTDVPPAAQPGGNAAGGGVEEPEVRPYRIP